MVNKEIVHSISDGKKDRLSAMSSSSIYDNNAFLTKELNAFTSFLSKLGFNSDKGLDTKRFLNGDLDLNLKELVNSDCSYPNFIRENKLSPLQRYILILTLLPELRPGILDQLFIFDKRIEKGMADFGGVKGKAFAGFIPTVETALFLFAGYNIGKRFKVLEEFYDGAPLIRKRIVILEPDNGETLASRKIEISKDVLAKITDTELPSPQFCSDFPAKRLHSPLIWSDDPEENDLILNTYTRNNLSEMINWVEHHDRLKGMKLTPGYRCLFYGPPGTGKTLTANLMGKRYNKPVYRIDLSLMVSKYIGETEKNLEKVFSMAENKDWILFFDEADALFGKRTEVRSSNDKFANQETSFLLQRVEDFPALVILSTNFKENLDKSFERRIQSIIYFPMPNYEERILLWEKALKKVSNPRPESGDGGTNETEHYTFRYADDVDIEAIAGKVEISGAAIDNVIRYCVLSTFRNYFTDDSNKNKMDHYCVIERNDLLKAIRRELNKDGKVV